MQIEEFFCNGPGFLTTIAQIQVLQFQPRSFKQKRHPPCWRQEYLYWYIPHTGDHILQH